MLPILSPGEGFRPKGRVKAVRWGLDSRDQSGFMQAQPQQSCGISRMETGRKASQISRKRVCTQGGGEISSLLPLP